MYFVSVFSRSRTLTECVSAFRQRVLMRKGGTLDDFIKYLRTELFITADPNYLEAAVTYAYEIW